MKILSKRWRTPNHRTEELNKPNRENKKKSIPRHATVEVQNIKDKKLLKVARKGKSDYLYKTSNWTDNCLKNNNERHKIVELYFVTYWRK